MAKGNIIKVHRAPKLNIGIILLVIIFVYVAISIFLYIKKDKVLTYEVSAGKLSADNTFRGVLIFDEDLIPSDYAGYINYFIPDNSRAGVRSIICSVDETGTISNLLSKQMESNRIDTETKQNIHKELNNYSKTYKGSNFRSAYDLLDNIDSVIAEYRSEYMSDSLEQLMENNDASFFNIMKSENSCMISLSTDNLVGLQDYQVNKDTFDETTYSRDNLKTRSLIGVGNTLYRRINSDRFSIVFPLNETQKEMYKDSTAVKVTFLDHPISATSSFSIINNEDGEYGVLSFEKYLINFMDSRFVEFELSESSPSGLKIPVSAVFDKDFYTIPVSYAVEDGENGENGFRVMTYDPQGNITFNFIEATLYSEENGYYYVSKDLFSIGDCVVKSNDSDEFVSVTDDDKYIIGTLGSLKGVYSVNKGYCQFRKIEIIDKNDEYYIVKKGTKYGLSIYDHIILNHEMATENQIIY